MLGLLGHALHILAAVSLCSGCSYIFGDEGGDGTEADAADAADAADVTAAVITLGLPVCGDTKYVLGGQSSTSPVGTYIEEYQWTMRQGERTLASVMGGPETPIVPGAHVLSGSSASFDFNPSLFSTPTLLKVALSGVAGTNQVYQHDLIIGAETEYELSFVVASDVAGVLRPRLIGHVIPNPSLATIDVIDTSATPQRVVLPFTTTIGSANGRLMLDFNTVTTYWLDNVQLVEVSAGSPLLANGRFDIDREPWKANFAGSGSATVEGFPISLAGFEDTEVSLVVVDSAGGISEPATMTIDADLCTE